jgi:hypothetical protein
MRHTDPTFGVSFSIKQCRKFGIDPHKTLDWLIEKGFKRFRLMSYWDEHEQHPGKYDFAELDWQMERIAEAGGQVTLCLGARQPRWPENHWPNWAWNAGKDVRSAALLRFIEEVVTRYWGKPVLASYQLENEALLHSFGERSEIDIDRLVEEFQLVKHLDPDHPVIMSTSTSWGIPWNDPTPDIVGFSYYHVVYDRGSYKNAHHYAWMHRARHRLIRLIKRRPVFIHELQLEPWGPKDIWEMTSAEQDRSMGATQIAKNVRLAKRTRLKPIDLWGGEWWYWRLKKHNDPSVWAAVKKAIS